MAFVPYAEGKAIGFGSGLPRAIHAQHMHEQARQAAAQAQAAAAAQGEAASSVAAAATAALQNPRAEQGYTTRPNLVRQLTGGLQALCTRIVTAAAAADAQQRNAQHTQRRSGSNNAAGAGGSPQRGHSYQQQQPSGSPDSSAAASASAAAAASSSPTNAAEWTRSDGFLRLSPTLPLLNYRYRVLSLVGEGTFSQLAVAEDTFAPSPPSQHHLAGMYGCATCSEVPQASAAAAAAAGRPNVIPRHRLVALKIMNSKYAFIGVQELDKLFTLNQRDQRSWCPIVRVQGPGAFYFHTHLVLVLELLGPALLSYMKNLPRGRVPVDQLRKIALQLVLALGYVSTAGMIHGDIKPENCLLEPRGRGVKVKLIDFGNAMTLHEAQAYYEDFEVQTLYYRAPEVVLGVKFNQQIDMWSLGCLLVELATGKPMFSSLNNTQLFQGMQRILGPANPAPFVAGRFFKMHFTQAQQNQAAESAAALAAGGPAAAAAAVLHNETQLIRITNIAKLLHSKDPDFVSFVHGLLEYDPAKRLSSHKALLHPFLSYLFPLSVILGEPRPLLTVSLPLALPQPTGTPPMRSIARAEARRQAEENRKRAHQAQQQMLAAQAQAHQHAQHQQHLMAQKSKQQQSSSPPYLHSGSVPPSSLGLLSSNMSPSSSHPYYNPAAGATYSPHSSPPSPYLQQQQQQAAKEEAIKLQQSILALGQQLAQHQQANAQALQMQQMMAAASSPAGWQQLGPAALQQQQQAHLQQQQMHLMQQNQQQQQQQHHQPLQQRRMSHSYAADAGTLQSQQHMQQQQSQPQPQMEEVSTSSGANRRRKLDAAPAPASSSFAAAAPAPASSPNGSSSSSTIPPKAKKARAAGSVASTSEAMSSPIAATPAVTAPTMTTTGGLWSNMSTPPMIGATIGAAAGAPGTSSPPRHSPDSNGHPRSPVPSSASKRSGSRGGSTRGGGNGARGSQPAQQQSYMMTDDTAEEGNGRDADNPSPDDQSSMIAPRRGPPSVKTNSRTTTPTHSARVLQLSSASPSSLDKFLPLSPRARLGLAPLSSAGGGFHHASAAASTAAPNGRSSTPRDRSASLTERRLHNESPTPSPIDFTARQSLLEQATARGFDPTSARNPSHYSSAFMQQDDAEDAAMLSRDDRPRGPSSRALDRTSAAAAAAGGVIRTSSLSSLSSPKFSSPLSISTSAAASAAAPTAPSPRGPSSRAKLQSTLASLPMRQ